MNTDEHLSRISTMWTDIRAAHRVAPEVGESAAYQARCRMVERYSGAIYRYLRKVVGNSDTADELFQEFAVQMVRGDFRGAQPERGRFRDYLKTSLLHLVAKHRRRVQRQAGGQELRDELLAADQTDELTFDREFLASVREELLNRAWGALQRSERQQGKPWFTALQFRAQNPQATSTELAARLSQESPAAQPVTPTAARKVLERARKQFADFLLDEIAATLDDPSRQRLEEEVLQLELHPYCRTALERRGHDP